MQLKIYSYYKIVVEWIPYNQLIDIKELRKDGLIAISYSAIWTDGPLQYNSNTRKYSREYNNKVNLRLYNSQNINKFLNEV
jgi:hypothetical protein